MKAALLFFMIVALIAMAMAGVHHHHHQVRDNADNSRGTIFDTAANIGNKLTAGFL